MEIYYQKADYVLTEHTRSYGDLDVYEYEIIAVVGDVAMDLYTVQDIHWPEDVCEPFNIMDYIHDGLLGMFQDFWEDSDNTFPASEIPIRFPGAIKYIPE